MVCQNCGKSLVRGYSFCMECGSPVPPEALEEAGMPPRTGDHAENPSGKPQELKSKAATENSDKEVPQEPTGGMPDVKPLMAGGNDDSEDSGEKTLVFCKNCGTVMQSNPYTCEKCGEPIADRPNGIPLFRNPDELFDGSTGLEEDMNLSEMLGADGSPLDDEMDAEAAKMFGINSGTHSNINSGSQFSAADLEMLNMQMSKYSQSTGSQMPLVGRDVPEPEPPKPPQPVDKDAPIIAEEEFNPETLEFMGESPAESEISTEGRFASVEPMQESSKAVSYSEPKPRSVEPEPPVIPQESESTSVPKPVELTKPRFVEPQPPAPVIAPEPVNQPDSTVSDRDDYLLPEEDPQKPEMHMPKYMYFGIIIIILCITMGIIFANLK